MLGTTHPNSDLLTLAVNGYYDKIITGYCQPF